MSVQLPIVSRGIWIPDPSFSYPIETGKYWTPASGITGDIYYRCGAYTANTLGRYVAINMDAAADSYADTWQLTSALSPSGVASGPHDETFMATVRVRVFVVAKTSGGWHANATDLMRAYVDALSGPGAVTESTAAIALTDAASATLGGTGHTSWTLFTGTATIATDTTSRHYRVRLQFRDYSTGGSAGRYIELAFCGLASPFEATDPYMDRLASWYEATPQMQVAQHSVQGRPGIQQVITLGWTSLSDTDIDLLRRCAYWNMRTPTDDVTRDVVNRGVASPVIMALDRGDAKKCFYADIGGGFGANVATAGGQTWLESGNIWNSTITFTERLYQ